MTAIIAMPHDLESWAKALGLVAGVLVSLGIIIKAVRSTWSFFRKAARVFDKIERELNTNGGSSLMDKVNRIDERLGDVEVWRHAADARIAHLEVVHAKQLEVEAIVSRFTPPQRKAQ